MPPGVPESFKVLVKELQSLGLAVEVINEEDKTMHMDKINEVSELENGPEIIEVAQLEENTPEDETGGAKEEGAADIIETATDSIAEENISEEVKQEDDTPDETAEKDNETEKEDEAENRNEIKEQRNNH